MWRTDGRVYELGNTQDSFFEFKDSSEAMSWIVNSMEDFSGNVVDYAYYEDAEGTYYPKSISYANRTIGFEYEDRTDAVQATINDKVLKINKLLNKITVKVDGTMLYSYNVTYDKSTDPSKATKISYCDKDAKCKSLNFEWSELNSAQKLHAVSKITNDLGKELIFTYTERTDLGTTSEKVYGVSQHKATNAVGGFETVDYSYGKEIIQIEGTGVECDYKKSIHNDTQISTNTYFLKDETFAGYTTRIEHVNGGKTMDRTNISYKKDDANNFIYSDSETTEEYGLDEKLLKSETTDYTYDGKMNILKEESTLNGGYVSTVERTYLQSDDPRLIVLPVKISAKNTSPYGYENSKLNEFSYDDRGRIITEKLSSPTTAQITRKYTYDAYGNIASMELSGENAEPIKYTYTYDSNGINNISLTGPYGKSSIISYDISDNPIEQKDHDGFFEKREYDNDGNLIKRADSKNSVTTFGYSICTSDMNCPANAVTQEKLTDEDGKETIKYKDIYGRVVGMSSSMPGEKRSIVQYRYDSIGNMIAVSNPHFEGETNIEWRTFTFDLLRRPLSMGMEGVSEKTTMMYDGNKIIETDAKGYSKTIFTDSKGNIAKVTDNYGNSVMYEYDGNGKLVKITKPSGQSIINVYDDFRRLVKSIDPERGTYTYTYDVYGNLIKTTDPKQQSTVMAYDKLGKITSKSGPDFEYAWAYDQESNRPVKAVSSDYSKVVSYDSVGNLLESNISVNDREYDFDMEYDELSRVKTITYPTGFGVRYEYGTNGELEKILKANIDAKVVTTFLKNETDIYDFLYENVFSLPDYDKYANGKKDYREEITYYDYLKKFFDKLALFYTELNDPENDGKIVSEGNVSVYNELKDYSIQELWERTGEYKNYEELFGGNAIFSKGNNYDDFIAVYMTFSVLFQEQLDVYTQLQEERSGEPVEETAPGNKDKDKSANQGLALGLVKAAAREAIEKFYKGIVTVLDKDVMIWQAEAFSPEGMVVGETYGNGVKTTIDLEPKDRFISTLVSQDANGTGVQDWKYGYDANGNIVMKKDEILNHDETFEYDGLNRLTNANYGENKTLDLSFDEEGNIVYKSNVGDYTYLGDSNLLASAGYRSYEYDANGNMIKGNGMTIEWTSFNKPSKIIKNGITTTFQYDANHNRIVQTRTDGLDTIQRVYIGNYEEVIVNGKVKEWLHYIFAGEKRVALFTVKDDMTVDIKYLHTDNLGSIRTITGPDGSVLQRFDYDPYGRKISVKTNQYTLQELEQNSLITPRGYTGHEHLEESDLIHMNARLYDPIVGRFVSPDSIIPDEYDLNGMNRLSYVRNNPLIYTDPTGNSWLSNKAKKLWKKKKKALKKAIANFSIDDVKRFAGTVNDNKWMPTSGEILNAPGAAAIDVMDGVVRYTLVEPGTTIRFALDSSAYALGETANGLVNVAGQVIDYCEQDPISCASYAAVFVPGGQAIGLSYFLIAGSTMDQLFKCQTDDSNSASDVTDCQNRALAMGALSAVGTTYGVQKKAMDNLGFNNLRTGDKVAVASIASICAIYSETKKEE